MLAWDKTKFPDDQGKTIKPTDRILNAFVKLHAAPDDAILKFARRNGVFGAARLPDDAPHGAADLEGNSEFWRVSAQRNSVCSEPLAFWRDLISYAVATLRIAERLNRSPAQNSPQSDWDMLGVFRPEATDSVTTVDRAQFLLMLTVQDWLTAGRVRLGLKIDGRSSRETRWKSFVALGPVYSYNLFGALALQVMQSVAGVNFLSICSGCVLPYTRTKQAPRNGDRNYCDDCGDAAARKDADKVRKARMKEARSLHKQGLSIADIATRIGTKPTTVSGWVKSGSRARSVQKYKRNGPDGRTPA
jgi:hypothetical protein